MSIVTLSLLVTPRHDMKLTRPISGHAPDFEKVGDILVSACSYVCVCGGGGGASRYRLETSCMDSSWKNSRRIFLVFHELSPLVKLRPFDKQGDEIL